MPDTKRSAAESVYEKMRSLILRGDLVAGQSLRASALQKAYGFSATPLREALNRLSVEHLVENAYHQGFRVASLSLDELEDLDTTRSLLEIDMLRVSLRQGDEDWEGRIVASHYQFSKLPTPHIATTPDAFEHWYRRHHTFHEALLSGCSSRWMRILLDQIETQRTRYHRNILLNAVREARNTPAIGEQINGILSEVLGIDAHTPLMEATLNRDEPAAERLMADHIRLTSDAYQRIQSLFPHPEEQRAEPSCE